MPPFLKCRTIRKANRNQRKIGKSLWRTSKKYGMLLIKGGENGIIGTDYPAVRLPPDYRDGVPSAYLSPYGIHSTEIRHSPERSAGTYRVTSTVRGSAHPYPNAIRGSPVLAHGCSLLFFHTGALHFCRSEAWAVPRLLSRFSSRTESGPIRDRLPFGIFPNTALCGAFPLFYFVRKAELCWNSIRYKNMSPSWPQADF